MHSTFVAFLIEVAAAYALLIFHPLLTCALDWRFKSPGPDFTNRLQSPFIIFAFHRSLITRKIGPRVRTALTCTYYTPCLLCLVYTRVTYQVTWSNSKRLRRMSYEAAFRTVFRAKKRRKEAFEVPCFCFNVLPEVLRRYPKKWLFGRQFRNLNSVLVKGMKSC